MVWRTRGTVHGRGRPARSMHRARLLLRTAVRAVHTATVRSARGAMGIVVGPSASPLASPYADDDPRTRRAHRPARRRDALGASAIRQARAPLGGRLLPREAARWPTAAGTEMKGRARGHSRAVDHERRGSERDRGRARLHGKQGRVAHRSTAGLGRPKRERRPASSVPVRTRFYERRRDHQSPRVWPRFLLGGTS